MVTIRLEDGRNFQVQKGSTLYDFAQKLQDKHPVLITALKINNKLTELHKTFTEELNDVVVVDMKSMDGVRIYQRSLSFVLIRAVLELFPETDVNIDHSLSKGINCTLRGKELLESDIPLIKQRMSEIISANEAFVKRTITKTQAYDYFQSLNMPSKYELLKYREADTINVYQSGWLMDYFYGYMLPRAGMLFDFDLVYYKGGMILMHPTTSSPTRVPAFEEQPKIADALRESEAWGDILGIGFAYNLNDIVASGKYGEMIRISEALHEKKIAQIADQISEADKRLVLIAGPSSSGKTTFAHRLMVQLQVNGLRPITLSTDDYFVNREFTPLDEEGKYDFESIDAVDTDQFNQDLAALLRGEEVHIPTFNFHLGQREYKGNRLQIEEGQVVIIEGIHGLNEKLTAEIPADKKFKIYISALTQLNIDNHNRIPTTDTRLLRRIVRDSKYRGHSALTTLRLWPSVRRGEEKNIFPFQESADAVFNSAIIYELSTLRKYAEPLLQAIPPTEHEYAEATRLLKFLSYFKSMDSDRYIVNTALIREFIGGSCFHGEV